MHIDNARELKAQLRARSVAVASAVPGGVAGVGISVLGHGPGGPRYGLAVRYSGERGEALLGQARALAGTAAAAELDVRDVGRVRALTAPAEGRAWTAAELRRRVRPLHPGLSIAHRDVTAGTLGAFVTVTGSDGVYALSNNHVLADSDQAALDDPVLQPGPSDAGRDTDHVGRLARAVPLDAGGGNAVDAALALLEDLGEDGGPGWEPVYPVGRLTGWTDADDEVAVEKVGRTTGLTRGRVSAIELDDVAVEYPVGVVSFEGQVEVTGDVGAFSAGGDSGSLVYRPDTRQAIGLLFAGSERGGANGAGLTFCNPIGLVLDALGATLVV
ncbi:S1 family peptidase [Paenibacillus sp. TRM 82003]|uniref:S1 family peptidase n=1 Tax=Kineococcus sp. TRM81007 TaxID=2925831 RepID=UPI001F595A75|nr:S1 family peptidase [Kineococcus sp. TRM81007]MCI2237956.1 S1 family peptidase [Kineococcus sp. TRM81007]MCI3925971.1 S1 family peptidase [Paenibacillus sp. TRM 82003]